MKKIIKSDEGFTGLEAAIVLIAFVVVAAVFSYVVLGAGFFTTQKSQEVVYSSVDMASSSMEVLGDVYGISADTSTTNKRINAVQFILGLTAGGTPVDLAKTTLVFQNDRTIKDLTRLGQITSTSTNVVSDKSSITALKWGIIEINNADGDGGALLENQKQFTIYAHISDGHSSEDERIVANENFNLEIKPSVGASYGIKRTAPAEVKAVNVLY
ncbi:flagellin [Methanoplanus endosymbiosus]|uniref:Flagellin n=2 Tax=Methanoplanus endosymbiosus TaxID=33865 RepID=A0A9E7TLL4_9EURY|nr:flagellin [Methanoplanus endosymbiosus]